jgi:hypothetical protein
VLPGSKGTLAFLHDRNNTLGPGPTVFPGLLGTRGWNKGAEGPGFPRALLRGVSCGPALRPEDDLDDEQTVGHGKVTVAVYVHRSELPFAQHDWGQYAHFR